MIRLFAFVSFILMSACATPTGERSGAVTDYRPAALGPQMDLESIRYDARNRAR